MPMTAVNPIAKDSVTLTLTIESPRGDGWSGCRRHVSKFVIDKDSHVSISLNGNGPKPTFLAQSWTRTTISPPLYTFSPCDSPPSCVEWATLTALICSWLVQTKDQQATDEWKWGVNYFWIAYTGAYPTFPYEPTAMPQFAPADHWDPAIHMSGTYLSARMDGLSHGYVPEEDALERVSLLRECLKQRADAIGEPLDLD
ncbi:hypothetical protein BOTBODRAFT_177055 [Botryobasidium botryosum FD-172 SS1]|uniref:Uncharacterized protein n=1 Tax=Botryobasidium botryosum (strain FD-172 SS1) TaxID=930990 RepID=A0A067MID7_BOTB1|nr:hypothetical protein BOTBODRAFT_177055 [Botryobasidium botryosum FD-172 SS1]